MDAEFTLKNFSDYCCKMIDRYASHVKEGILQISKDTKLTDLSFVDSLKVKKLVLDQCFNIVLKNLPKKVTSLSITNSKLFNIEGIQEMIQLLELDLTGNRLVSLQPLSQIKGLKRVIIDGNFI